MAYWRDVLEERDYERTLRWLRMSRRQAKLHAGREWDAAQAILARLAADAEQDRLAASPEFGQLVASAWDDVTRTAEIPTPRSIPPPAPGSIAIAMARLPLRREREEQRADAEYFRSGTRYPGQ